MKRFVPDLASLRSPLARRLIVAIILVSSTITLCLTAFQLYGEYRSELEIIEGDFRQIDAVHLKSLSQSLWTTDEAELRLQIEGVVHLPNLEYVVVREGDRILAQAGRRVSSKIIERQYPLTNVHRGQTLEIGTLTVVAGLDTVYRELAKRVFIILASNAFKTFLVAGFAFAFFHWLVNRHLLAIAGYLRGLDLRGRASPLILARAAGRRPDELDEVAAQLNRMLDAQMEAFRQLRENEEARARLAAIVESSNDAIIGRGRDRTIISWNAAAERILGYTAAEAIGRDLAANYPPDMRQEAMEIRRLVGTGVSVPYFETVRITKDGRRIDVGLSVSPIRDSNGNTIGTAAIIRDITERKRAEQAAAAQSRLTEAVFSYSVSCLAILDRDFNFIRVNDAYARVCRKDIAEFAGRNHFDMYPSDAKLIFDEVVRDKRPFETFARPFVFPDQPEREVTYWDWTLVPVLDQRGEVQYLVFSLNEVTERKQAEVALREREHLMRLVTENVPAMIAYFDAELICRFANAAYCEFHRLDPQGVIGKTLREIAGDNTYRVIRPSIYLVKAGKPTLLHREEHTATGGIRHIEIHRVPDMSPEGAFRGYYAMLLDVTERQQAEQTLQTAHARLRELTRRLQEVEATERNAISRELHDRIGQGLSTLSLMVGTLGARLPEGARRAIQPQMKDIQALLRSVVAHVRDIMAELRPPALDDYGLFVALRHFVTEFAKRTGIAVNLNGVDPYPRLPLIVETAMFRISQEALNNIAKHAHAKKVEISLNAISDRVVLDIADDGVGFDASNTPDGGKHWGMITMRERAEAVGITFRLESATGAGTQVVLEVQHAAS